LVLGKSAYAPIPKPTDNAYPKDSFSKKVLVLRDIPLASPLDPIEDFLYAQKTGFASTISSHKKRWYFIVDNEGIKRYLMNPELNSETTGGNWSKSFKDILGCEPDVRNPLKFTLRFTKSSDQLFKASDEATRDKWVTGIRERLRRMNR